MKEAEAEAEEEEIRSKSKCKAQKAAKSHVLDQVWSL